MPLRVLIDMGNAPPKTGIGIYGQTLLRSLNHYCSDDVVARDSGTSWPGHRFRPARRLVYLWQLSRLRSNGYNGANVVHFINQYVPRPHRSVPSVVTIHDLDPLKAPEAHSRRYSMYFAMMIKQAISRATLIETHSEVVRNEILDTFHIPGDRIKVAGDGPSEDFVDMALHTEKTMPSLPTLLYVGQISKKKNVEWLVSAVVKGVRKGALPLLKLVVAGGKGYQGNAAIREIWQSGGIAWWYKRPSLKELVDLYCTCSAVVLPSVREGLGRTLLEAMWCDKPMIASKIAACLEVAREAANYFDLGSEESLYYAIHQALEDRNARLRREISRVQRERYSWQVLSRLFCEIYKEAYARQ